MLGSLRGDAAWTGGRVRADYMHGPGRGPLRGSTGRPARRSERSKNSGHAGADRRGAHAPRERAPRRPRVRASYYAQDSDFVVQASWYRLLETRANLTAPFDPYYATLFNLFPYSQVGLLASKSLGPHLGPPDGPRRPARHRRAGHRRVQPRFIASSRRPHPRRASREARSHAHGEVWDSQRTDIRTSAPYLSASSTRRSTPASDVLLAVQVRPLPEPRARRRPDLVPKIAWKRAASTTFDLRYEYEDDQHRLPFAEIGGDVAFSRQKVGDVDLLAAPRRG